MNQVVANADDHGYFGQQVVAMVPLLQSAASELGVRLPAR